MGETAWVNPRDAGKGATVCVIVTVKSAFSPGIPARIPSVNVNVWVVPAALGSQVHCAAAAQLDEPDLVAASGDRQLLAAWRELGIATYDPGVPGPS